MNLNEQFLQSKGFVRGPDGEWRKPKRQAGGVSSSPEPKQIVRDESLATAQRAQSNSFRYAVCIASYRHRLIDPDNLCGKYFVDCLRYAGVIPDDTAAIVDYSIKQFKVKAKKEQRTVIIVTPI